MTEQRGEIQTMYEYKFRSRSSYYYCWCPFYCQTCQKLKLIRKIWLERQKFKKAFYQPLNNP